MPQLTYIAANLMLNLSYLALFCVSCLGFGWISLRLIKSPICSIRELFINAISAGMGVITLIMLVLGAIKLYYPEVGWGIILSGSAIFIYGILLDYRKLKTGFVLKPPIKVGWFSLVLFIILTSSLIFPLFSNALVPASQYDELAYHLAIPKLFVQAHRITNINFIVYANWPLGTEMLNALNFLWASENVARFVNWLCLALLCLCLFHYGKKWFDSTTGLIAAVILVTTPMALTLAGTNLVEIPLALFTTLAAFNLFDWLESEQSSKFVLSAFFAGIAAGIKLNAAMVGVILGIILVIGLWLKHRSRLRMILKHFIVYGILVSLFVLPWYLRSWYQTGNPFWPFLYNILGGRNWDAPGLGYLLTYIRITNLDPNIVNWITGLVHLTINSPRFGGFVLGFTYLLTLPLSIFVTARSEMSRNPLIARLLGILVLLLYTSWFIQTHQTRFFMPALGIFALLASIGINWLLQTLSSRWRLVFQIAIAVYFLAISWMASPRMWEILRLNYPYLNGQISREEFLTNRIPGFPVFDYINKNLPKDAKILMSVWESRGYLLDRDYIWANPLSQRTMIQEDFHSVNQLARDMRRRGITHVLLNHSNLKRFPYPFNQQVADLYISTLSQKAKLVYSSSPIELYELIP